MLIQVHDSTTSLSARVFAPPRREGYVVFCMDCRRVRLDERRYVSMPKVLEAAGEHASSSICPECATLRGITPEMIEVAVTVAA